MVCCKVTKRTSFICSVLFWISGACSTGMKSYELMKTAEILDTTTNKYKFTLLLLLGVVLGFLQCYFVFVKICHKNYTFTNTLIMILTIIYIEKYTMIRIR